jgi:hypothetical protein
MSEQKSASDAASALRPAPPMNQYPKGDVAPQTPLHHVFASGLSVQDAADAGLVFREQSQLGLLTLRMNSQNSEQILQCEMKVIQISFDVQFYTPSGLGLLITGECFYMSIKEVILDLHKLCLPQGFLAF